MKNSVFFGFENNEKKTRGWIFLVTNEGFGIHFANFYTMPDDGPEFAQFNNKKVFNRDSMAIQMGFTNNPPLFNNLDEMKIWIEDFLSNLKDFERFVK